MPGNAGSVFTDVGIPIGFTCSCSWPFFMASWCDRRRKSHAVHKNCGVGRLLIAMMDPMKRVLISESIAERGIEVLREAGFDVDVQIGLEPAALLEAIVGARALVVRSATQVTAEVLAAGSDLEVVGRAGVGLDNVDVSAATAQGVMVVNAPESNIVSAAEHTIALMMAQARNIPQAHAALIEGRWERSKWEGVELAGKTLGIVGFGRIGHLVATRAKALGMHIVAHDPFVSDEGARKDGVTLLTLDELVGTADFLTLHLAKTPDTIGLIGKELLQKARPELRVNNVARGGIVDEVALAEAVSSGQIAGAAIDVFDSEPITDSPLFGVPGIIVTPHLGASTREAQDKAGIDIAEQVQLALAGEFVPFAVNVDAGAAPELLKPFIAVGELIGAIFAGLIENLPQQIDVEFRGEISAVDSSLAVLSVLKGVLAKAGDGPVSYVNVKTVAEQRGIEVRTVTSAASLDRINVLTVRGSGHSVGAIVSSIDGEARIIEVDGHRLELRPRPDMLIIRNEDLPGVVGAVGWELGNAGVNISSMHLGESEDGVAALMVVATDEAVPATVIEAVQALDNVESVRSIRIR